MKLVDTNDIYTKSYKLKRWASLGFDYDAKFDADIESDEAYSDYNYT